MVGVFAEFERSMISERVKLGLKRLKSKGIKLGRPKSVDRDKVTRMKSLRSQGLSLSEIAKEIGVSKMTIQRHLKL